MFQPRGKNETLNLVLVKQTGNPPKLWNNKSAENWAAEENPQI